MKKLTAKQVAALSPEARERYEKKLKTVKRNRRILTGFVAVIAVAAVFAVLSVTVLFNITEVKVAKPGKHYKAEEILDAAGVEVGDNMVLADWDRVRERIETKLPYILSVDINKTVSGRVTFSVTDDKAAMIFKTETGYAIADYNGKALEIVKTKPKNSGLILLTIKNKINAKPGEMISFSDAAEESLYSDIKSAISESGITGITGIDISDSKNIYLEYRSRYRLYMGDSSDLVYKLKEAKKVIAQEDESDPNQIGEINLSILKKVYVEKLETLEKTTVPAAAKPEKTTAPQTTEVSEEQAQPAEDEEETTAPEEDVTEPDEANVDGDDAQNGEE